MLSNVQIACFAGVAKQNFPLLSYDGTVVGAKPEVYLGMEEHPVD